LQRREKIAQLTENVKNNLGLQSNEGKQALAIGSEKLTQEADSRKDLAEREYKITMDTLDVSEKMASTQLRGSVGALESAKAQLDLAERTQDTLSMTGTLEQQKQAATTVALAHAAHRQAEIALANELTSMRLATQQAEAQFKGMQGVAEQAAIVAKFDKEIADQLRAGNKEAAEMLQRQKDIAMAQEMAREHDVTGTQRHDARRDARIVQRKARQQGQREEAIRKDAARGARGKRITEQQLKDRNANEGKMRQAQATADARTFMTQMSSIVGRLASIDSSLEGDA
jgi:hypothetical protein